MRLRNLLMATTFVLAATGTFASKKIAKAPRNASTIVDEIYCIMEFTEQSNCSVTNTGPVCTVNVGGLNPHSTAYANPSDGGYIPCTVPFRQP